jgi:hypothetical protein
VLPKVSALHGIGGLLGKDAAARPIGETGPDHLISSSCARICTTARKSLRRCTSNNRSAMSH